MKPEELTAAIRAAYCMDLHTYEELFGEATVQMWHLQQKDFDKWFTKLDSQQQGNFIEYVNRK